MARKKTVPPPAPLVAAVSDAVLARLREIAPATARALAEGVPAEALSLAALADWLEERQYGEMARQVRRLDVGADDLLVLTVPGTLSPDLRHHMREQIRLAFEERGRTPPLILVLGGGMRLEQFRLREVL